MSTVLVVDGANVVGSRPDGWWRDRAGAAARLHGRLAVADTSYDEIVLVLEGQAKAGVPRGRDGHLLTVHAPKDGYLLVLLADQELEAGRGEQARCLLEAAYAAFDATTGTC